MNSIGGDAGVAILIHNETQELAAKAKTDLYRRWNGNVRRLAYHVCL